MLAPIGAKGLSLATGDVYAQNKRLMRSYETSDECAQARAALHRRTPGRQNGPARQDFKQTGEAATDCRQRILDIQPASAGLPGLEKRGCGSDHVPCEIMNVLFREN